ncbi:hypothetical protein M9Y10_041064 [Tritrichomonas musculus]|uniref:Protein kinase domain-containing protein n=1 Tax=Tritrichomonas musculus TaxID=1915356 RepID=A0ABR2K3B6_9EUKA
MKNTIIFIGKFDEELFFLEKKIINLQNDSQFNITLDSSSTSCFAELPIIGYDYYANIIIGNINQIRFIENLILNSKIILFVFNFTKPETLEFLNAQIFPVISKLKSKCEQERILIGMNYDQVKNSDMYNLIQETMENLNCSKYFEEISNKSSLQPQNFHNFKIFTNLNEYLATKLTKKDFISTEDSNNIVIRLENSLVIKLFKKYKKATIIKSPNVSGDLRIPSFIQFNSTKYEIALIGFNAFCDTSLKSLAFEPDSKLKGISNCAFDNSSLTSFYIPANLSNLDDLWCRRASKLKMIEIDPKNVFFSIENDLLIYDKSEVVLALHNFSGDFSVPSGIILIRHSAFNECKGIRSFSSISSSKLTIGNFSFNNCENLEKVEIKNKSDVNIGKSSFSFLPKLSSIEIECDCLTLGERSFEKCTSISSISFSKVKRIIIDDCAFNGCLNFETFAVENANEISFRKDCFINTNLKELILNADVMNFDDNCFNGCHSLKSIEIECKEKFELNQKTFFGCESLNEIKIKTSSDLNLHKNCFSDTKNLISVELIANKVIFDNNCFNNALMSSILIQSDDDISINSKMFGNYQGPSEKMIIKSLSNLTLHKNCFAYQSKLKNVDLSANHLLIENYCFDNCSSLSSFAISKSFDVKIGVLQFCNCNELENIEIEVESKLDLESSCFADSFNLKEVIIVGGNVKFNDLCFNNCKSLSSIVIANTETVDLSAALFYKCKSLEIIDIESKSSIKICSGCFYEAKKLKTIILESENIFIGSGCFFNCESLESFNIKNAQIITIENNVFEGCKNIEKIKINSKSSISIGSNCFLKAFKLKSIDLSCDKLTIKSFSESEQEKLFSNNFDKLVKDNNHHLVHEFEVLDENDINKYVVLSKCGTGTFSKVYQVKNNNKIYAKKVFKSKIFAEERIINDQKVFKKDINKMQTFINEYDMLKGLDHPNIIKTYGIFYGIETRNEDKNQVFTNPPSIILEYCKYSLKLLIEDLTDMERVRIIYEICIAMKYVHDKKITHRDLKPENILIDSNRHAKIGDFGTSTILSNLYSQTPFIGTIKYMAPEMMYGKYDHKVDIYSFGVLLYFILSRGETPRLESSDQQVKIPDGKFNNFASELIQKCMSYSPDNRPNFEDIINEINENDFKLINGVEKDLLSIILDLPSYEHSCLNCFNYTSLESVKLNADSFLLVGNNFFNKAKKLSSIELKSRNVSIDEQAFKGCCNLEKIVFDDETNIILGFECFAHTKIKSFNINAKLLLIGSSSFKNCSSLQSFNVPNATTINIFENAFFGCENIKYFNIDKSNEIFLDNFCLNDLYSIELQTSIFRIKENALSNCSRLTLFNVKCDNDIVINRNTFNGCDSLKNVFLISSSRIILMNSCFSSIKKLDSLLVDCERFHFDIDLFKNDISVSNFSLRCQTDINTFIFSNCDSFNEINLESDSSIILSPRSFENTKKLISIILKANSIIIKEDCFINCQSFKYFKIHESNFVTIENFIFYKCDDLQNVYIVINSNLQIIKKSFYGSINLSSVTLIGNDITIEEESFQKFKKILALKIKAVNVEIGKNAFYGCEKLESVNINDFRARNQLLFDFHSQNVIIEENSFSKCSSLSSFSIIEAEKVTLNNGVFLGCCNLVNVSICSEFKIDICSDCFKNLNKLSSVYFSSKEISLGQECLQNCSSLRFLTLDNANHIIIEKNVFAGDLNLHLDSVKYNDGAEIDDTSYELDKLL